jgi:short-subunit dehydrogenase
VIAGDITEPEVRTRLIETCASRFGGLDILVNNAGIGAIGRFDGASPDRLRLVMEVNFFAPVELIRLAIPLLRSGDRPLVVNISSVLGHRAMPLKSEYCASKFALHGWSDSVRTELERDGIDVLLVSPSTTGSEFFENVVENSAGEYVKLSNPKSPEWVARRTIQAMERGRREVILTLSGNALVWIDRLCPPLGDWIARRAAAKP